jgi:hypothetical protein
MRLEIIFGRTWITAQLILIGCNRVFKLMTSSLLVIERIFEHKRQRSSDYCDTNLWISFNS